MLQTPAYRQAILDNQEATNAQMEQAAHIVQGAINSAERAAVDQFPELRGAPVEAIPNIINHIRSTGNYARAQQIQDTLLTAARNSHAVIQNAQQMHAQHQYTQAQAQHQQAERDWYATNQRMREVSQAFESRNNMSSDEKHALGEFMSELTGGNVRDPLVRQLLTQPAFYEVALKAHKYEQLQKAGLPRPPSC